MNVYKNRLQKAVSCFLKSTNKECFLLVFAVMLSSIGLAQDRLIQGKIISVTDRTPIPGVNIVCKGTTVGTISDNEGNYSLKIADNVKDLVFSFIGFRRMEVEIGERSVVDISLELDITELSEIVVTGYSSINKKDIASSISVVDVDEMKKIASSNFADQLQGKVAGVQISTSGSPGAVQYVRIRGIGTINNNEPLYVVDGVPVQNETDMNFLNPNDIETMQVLKDAAAASIYGARASNGVVVITTKRGTGRSKLNVEFFTGMQDPQRFPELANPQELLEIQKGLYAGAGIPFNSTFYIQSPTGSGNWVLPDFMSTTKGYAAGDPAIDPSNYVLNTSDPDLYANNFPIAAANKGGTDWFNELFKPASMTSTQLSASGGSEKGSHYFSMNYYDHNGILIENKWQRMQARLNSTYAVGKNFRLGENLNMSFQTGTGFDGPRFNVENAYNYLPIVPLYDINGYWAAGSQASQASENPVAEQTRTADGWDSHNLRLTGNVFAEFDFLKYFSFKTNAGFDYFQQPSETYVYTCPECGTAEINSLEKFWRSRRSWILTETLNFNRSFSNHTIYALAGWEMRNAFNESFGASGSNLKYGDDPYYRELNNVQSGTYSIGSQSSDSKMISLFANVNYTYRDKYIVSATVRRDGSSKFINNKYAVFPGISTAWRISQEQFLNGSKFITDLKLRASYGITGNNEVVGGDYPGYTSYGTSPALSSYAINGSHNKFTQGFGQISSGNPDLKWETSHLTNLAFDATLMKQLDLTLEWYSRKTNDMILGVPQPLETGITFPINKNIGSMLNKGIDLQLSYKGKALSQKLFYTIGLTGTHYTNEVLALADSASFINGASLHGGYAAISRTQAGYPVSQFYGYVAEGLWASSEEINQVLFADPSGVKSGAKPGRMKFRDVNGDGRITSEDRTFIGSPIPKFILGLNLALNYKNFDFTSYFSGVFGVEIFNAVKSYTDFNDTDVLLAFPVNRSKRMLYEAGKSLPVLDLNDTYSGRISSYFVEDGSFFRCRNLVLGYTLPQRVVLKGGLSKARFYLQAQNLFTITNYSGLDPDVTILNMTQGNQARRDVTTGLDVGRYPLSKQYIIGVNIEF